MARSSGKIPTTSERRLISPFRRSSGFVLANGGQCSAATAKTIEAATAFAEKTFTDAATSHVFLYNAKAKTGFLVSNLDNGDIFETGVILNGAGVATGFDFKDIFALV